MVMGLMNLQFFYIKKAMYLFFFVRSFSIFLSALEKIKQREKKRTFEDLSLWSFVGAAINDPYLKL